MPNRTSPSVLWILLLGFYCCISPNALSQDTDSDGIPDATEKNNCIKPFERYFLEKEGELIFFRTQQVTGKIRGITKTSHYEIDYLPRRQALIDAKLELTKQFTKTNRELNESQRVCNNNNAKDKARRDACKRIDLLNEEIKIIKQQNTSVQGQLDELNDSLDVFKGIVAFRVQVEDTATASVSTVVLRTESVRQLFNTSGCLNDTDKDGFADLFDPCPKTPGENQGCPAEITQDPELIASNDIETTSAKDSLKTDSLGVITTVREKKLVVQDSIRKFNKFMESISDQKILSAGQTDTLKLFANYFSQQTKELNKYSEIVENTEVALNAANLKIKDSENFINSIRALILAFLLVTGISFFFVRRLSYEKTKLKRQITRNIKVTQDLETESIKLQEAYVKLEVNSKKIRSDAQELKNKNTMIELLLRELNHRVKNNLLAITAMLRTELDKGDPNTLKDKVEGIILRLTEVERLHAKLTYNEKNEEKIPLRDYFGEIVGSLTNLHVVDPKPTVLWDIPEVEISGGKAYFMGFILYELVTNSLKHSFKKITDPEIKISLEIPKDNQYKLVIQDNGQGLHQDLFEGDRFLFERVNSHGLKIISLITDMYQGSFLVSPESSRNSEKRGAFFSCVLNIK